MPKEVERAIADFAREPKRRPGRHGKSLRSGAELARRPVAVIVASGGPRVALRVKAEVTTIPIVFLAAEDPVMLGVVASLARPGGNLTGVNFFSAELVAKRLELMRVFVPAATRVAVLVNPTSPNTESTLRDVEPAARAMGRQIQVLNASTSREIDAAFATFVSERPDALFVGGDAFLDSRRVQLVQLANQHRVPATYSGREYAEVGGLMSYGSDITDAYRQVGIYAGRILKGRQTGRPAGRAGVQVRTGHQRPDRKDARPHRAAVAARPRRRGDRMKRREFIALLGGAAAEWPLAARAQERTRRVGFLTASFGVDDPEMQTRNSAFVLALREFGWAAGNNVRVEFRSGAGKASELRKHAAELVSLADVVLANGGQAVSALQDVSRTVPIVFVTGARSCGRWFRR